MLLVALSTAAQTPKEEYQRKYTQLVQRVGLSGVGVETLLQRWEADYPDDTDMLEAKFGCFFQKSGSPRVIQLSQDRYLGRDPLIPYKDSTGVARNYFEDTEYDDDLFSTATQALDKAISLSPKRLDYRLAKVSALTAYEKESPDMAMQSLKALIDYHYASHPDWVYPGIDKVDGDTFNALVQEHCYTFFKLGSPQCQEAFRDLSETMLKYNPNEPLFMDNLGSYYLVCQGDSKKALKYYNKVLKKHPDDLTAIQNCIILARKEKDLKLEKKYLPMLVKYAPDEKDRTAAQIRLDSISGKK